MPSDDRVNGANGCDPSTPTLSNDADSEDTAPVVSGSLPWRVVALGIVVLIGFRSLGLLPLSWLRATPPWVTLFSTFAAQAFMLIFPVAAYRGRRAVTLRPPIGSGVFREIGISILAMLGAFSVMIAFGLAVYLWQGEKGEVANPLVERGLTMPRGYFYALLLVAVAVAPVAEEMFFRGFLQKEFKHRMPWPVASVVQCFLFGAAHGYSLQAIWAFFIGLYLTAVIERRKTLFTAIVVHAFVNTVAAVVALAMVLAAQNRPYIGVVGHDAPNGVVVDLVAEGSPAERGRNH